MKYYSAIILAMLFACNSPQSSNKLQERDSQQSANAEGVDNTPISFKGLYTFGKEVNTFRDCSTGQEFWVNDSLNLMKITYQKVLQSFSYPYESTYAEVKGYLSGKSDLGYASEFENVLVVTEVIELSAKNFQTECYKYDFIAVGNEPFWSAEIIPNEKLIVMKDVAQNKVYLFPYQPEVASGTSIRYQTSNDLKDTLTLHFRKENCNDGMSDNTYFYSAEVNINGKVLKGCAIKKGDIIRQDQ